LHFLTASPLFQPVFIISSPPPLSSAFFRAIRRQLPLPPRLILFSLADIRHVRHYFISFY